MVYVPYLSHSIHKGLHIRFELKCKSYLYTHRKVQLSTKDVLTTNAMHNI